MADLNDTTGVVDVRIDSLDPELVERFRFAYKNNGLGEGTLFIRQSYQSRVTLFFVGFIITLLGVLFMHIISSGEQGQETLFYVFGVSTVIGSFYSIISVVDGIRIRRSDLKPFVLVTPTNVVKAGFPWRITHIRRLKDVLSFSAFKSYKQAVTYVGVDYIFRFTNGSVSFRVKEDKDINVLDKVLELAHK